MAKSFQERRKEKQKASFIGRSEHLNIFKSNLHSNDPINIFNIYGQGGVGKSYLISQYKSITEDNNCLTAYSDESVKSVLQWMESASDQLKKKNAELTDFDKRYKVYLQEIKKLETDPDKPKGTLGGIIKGVSRGLLKEGKKLPGADIIGEFIDEESLVTTISEWAEFARKKITNKDEVELVLEPEKVLTPLFWKGVMKHANEHLFVCFFIDTYEEVDTVLEKWLLDVLIGKHGDIPANILLIIAGREELNLNNWSDMKDLIQKIQLEPFTENEALEYLQSKSVTDPKVQNDIIQLSGRLPVLMAWLTDVVDHGAGAIEDPAQTAVERFLKWVQDKNQRNIALAAALPRRLNQDIIESLITDKSQAKSNFEWLTAQPFVLKRDDHWVYHSVVRDLMLRFVRTWSNKEWTSYQSCLEKYYVELQKDLELQPAQEFSNKKWMEYEHEKHYHQLCYKIDKFTPVIVQQFVRFIYEQGIYQGGTFGETLALAGKDIDHEISQNLGQQISAAIKEFSDAGNVSLLQQLTKSIQAYNWVQNEAHRAYILLVDGLTQTDNDEAIKAFRSAIAIKPDYAQAYYNLGYNLERAGDLPGAIDCYLKSIELKPDYLAAHKDLGLAYTNAGEYHKAIEVFKTIIENVPNDADALYNMGSAYYYLNDFNNSLDCFQQVLELNPDDYKALNNVGISWFNLKQYDKAVPCYLAAIELKPDYHLAYYNMGLLNFQSLDYEQALTNFQTTVSLKPDYFFGWMKVGETNIQLKNWDEAYQNFKQAITLNPNSADVYYFLGLVYSQRKDYPKAIDAFQAAIKLKPDDHDAMDILALSYCYNNEMDKGIEMAEKALELKPGFYSAYNTLGVCYSKKGAFNLGIDYFLKSIESKVDFSDAHYNLASIYEEQNDTDNAIKAYARMCEIFPADHQAFYHLGRKYGDKSMYAEAINAYERVLAIDSEFKAALIDLVWAAIGLKDYDKAIDAAQKTIALDPNEFKTIYNMGVAYFEKQNYEAAIQAYQQALTLNPEYVRAYARLGFTFMTIEEYEQAILNLEKAKLLGDKDYTTYNGLALSYSYIGEDEKAAEIYSQMIEMEPSEYIPVMSVGYFYLKNGKIDEAEPLLLKAKELSNNDLTNMNAGHVYLCRGDEEKALTCYEEGLSLAESEEDYLRDMNSDFNVLQQYGIVQDNYASVVEKIKRPVKTPTAN